MRQLIVTENASADGIVSPMDGWFDPLAADDDLLAVTKAHREAADALVLGRVTYEEFAGFWPHQDDDPTGVAAYLDAVAKYVVSSSLRSADWQNSTILREVGEIEALKQGEGGDIVVTGSVELVRAVQRAGLVDRYRIFVYPAAQGHGRQLFAEPARLELAEARTFRSGVVLLEYISAVAG
ncbi:dihydrofolate reductase family protein [Labedaea rhizosphaerae]|uniref:Dihydrofolate reductase n=1 Tax=Labedaea rhizosphaerae TaxID=598644 RepID=A0A4R6RT70_LABRH|nr:dihydrofolate reductase family protein [Labedaea rhizosphaerae]TDP89944.1 dihydrofolate reductase [Labedaea rhizosphaerae]